MLRFERFQALTFDCYGTLIDWETGIWRSLRPVFRRHRFAIARENALELFGALEAEAERRPYRDYKTVLREVLQGFGRRASFEPSDAECDAFSRSVGDWPAFPDSASALRVLHERYRLAIVSNVDDDLFAATAPRLGETFDWVVTAEQARSYKPAHENFRLALRRMNLPREQVLHVAQSLYHDIAPANALGIATVWVNRRRGRPGSGATPAAVAAPDFEVPDLRSLASAAGLAMTVLVLSLPFLPARFAHAETLVSSHPSVAAAIAATPDGGRLVFPAGDWECPDTAGWYINKTMEICGTGAVTGYETSGTRLRFHDTRGARRHANSTLFRLGPLARGVYMHDLVLTSAYGPAPVPGSGDAIRYDQKAIITELILERVKIAYAGRHGINLAPDSFVVSATLRNVGVLRCGGDGLRARGVTGLGLYSSGFDGNGGAGVRLTGCGTGVWVGSWAESNGGALTNVYYDGQVVLENCHGFAITGGDIEDFVRDPVRNGIVLNACSGVTLGGLSFGNPRGGGAVTGSRSVILLNGTRGCAIQPSAHNNVDIAVEVHADGTSTGNVIFPQPVAFPQLTGTNARLVIAPDQKTVVVK